VQFIIKKDKKEQFRFAPLQSDAGARLLRQYGLSTTDLDSFVLIHQGHAYKRSSGALRVAKLLGGGWRLLYGLIVIPKFIRDAVYKFVAKNRYKWYGKKDSCMVPTPALKARFLSQ
jgi:predicted DCC family thiol-disulfide oxidoreductase YuxK